MTSSNAKKVVKGISSQNIYFIPDGNLGRYVKEQVPEKNVILNEGFCPIHAAITKEEVLQAKKEHPMAKFLVHPECTKEVLEQADYIGSTADIIQFATQDEGNEFIIGTEIGVFYELKKRNPNKQFYSLRKPPLCADMKMITLEKVYDVLENEKNVVTVSEELGGKALLPLEKMMELAK